MGEGIKKSGVPREEIVVTSKIAFYPQTEVPVPSFNANNVKGGEEASFELCLEQLGLDYVDLLLVHNPCTGNAEYNLAFTTHMFERAHVQGDDNAITLKLPDGEAIRPLLLAAKLDKMKKEGVDKEAAFTARKNTWIAMEKIFASGRAKRIGVSNYTVGLLKEMESYANVMPCINQVELHPALARPDLQQTCRDMGIVLTAYGTGFFVKIEQSTVVAAIGERLNRTPQ